MSGLECADIIPLKYTHNPLVSYTKRLLISIKNLIKKLTFLGTIVKIPDLYYDKKNDFGFYPRPSEELLAKYYSVLGRLLSERLEFAQSMSMAHTANDMINWIEEKASIIKKDSYVADVGAGSGWVALSLIKRTKNVVVADLAITDIEHIKGLNDKISLELMEDFWSSAQEFDLICSIDVVEHLSDPLNFVKNLNNKLKKDGLVFISVPNFNSYFSKVHLGMHPYLAYPVHLNYFTTKSLSNLLLKAGFEVISCETTTYFSEIEYVSKNYPKSFNNLTSWGLGDKLLKQGNGEHVLILALKKIL